MPSVLFDHRFPTRAPSPFLCLQRSLRTIHTGRHHHHRFSFPFAGSPLCALSRCSSNATPVFIMSVVASRPESAAVPFSPIPQSEFIHCKDAAYAVTVQPVSSRTSSVSSFKSNYSVSTAPTVYSPISPTSPARVFDSAASLDKILESVFKRLPQEVYDVILDQLELLHVGPNQTGCLTCFQRDLHALSLTCRAWEKGVRAKL